MREKLPNICPGALPDSPGTDPADPFEYAFLAAFLLASAVSTILSDHRAEAWSGDAGRLQGFLLWLAYGAAFFCISRFHGPGKRHIWILLASATIVALWGICDYMGPGLSW